MHFVPFSITYLVGVGALAPFCGKEAPEVWRLNICSPNSGEACGLIVYANASSVFVASGEGVLCRPSAS